MNPTSHTTTITAPSKPTARAFARLAVALSVGGVLCFILFSLLHLERAAFAWAFLAELLAFLCGILGWSQRSARWVVFAQLAVVVLFAASVVFYFSLRV